MIDPEHPVRPIAADWLALRREADEGAREGTQRLLTRLWRHLQASPQASRRHSVHVIDLGAGTGANQSWLAPRLPFPATWTLVDHDPDLLHHPMQGSGQRVVAEVSHLPELLDQDQDQARVVTCSALLDLLSYEQLDDLADVLIQTRTPALLSLTVTGGVSYAPADEVDPQIQSAFDAHQGRNDLAGPDAARHLAARCEELGAEVVRAHTPWRLAAHHEALIERFLTDRVTAALEVRPELEDVATAWLRRRLKQARAGTLALVVDHEDLLVLPAHANDAKDR
ncbi:SAM-dependent methyltransferase [Gephyromycinifex aptenodytis]|uniref:SAM-dependent methyltransferase n=1 Tax=Gephyromycinifex aptenodytis TaxID=2716227 RepID=UPI00144512B1|nr:SAM-dependent methyltransferase [Gephyromycinifex aptenodytis]